MRCDSTGVQVGWTTKTSAPRTFSRIWRWISLSEKRLTAASAIPVPSSAAIARARVGLALPVKTFSLSNLIARIGFGAAMPL